MPERNPFSQAEEEAKKIKELAGNNATAEEIELSHKLISEDEKETASQTQEIPQPAPLKKAGKFDVKQFRDSLALKLKSVPDHKERRKILKEAKIDEDYATAEKFTRLKRRLEARTAGFFTPERVDILTSLINYGATNENTDAIMELGLEELIFELAQNGSDFNLEKIDELLRQNLKHRDKMVASIEKYIADQNLQPKQLRDHQLSALVKMKDFISKGHLRGYISHPTGAGKTVLFNSLIKATGARTLIIVPSKVILENTVAELREFLPDKKVTYISSLDEKHMKGNAEKGAEGEVVVTIDKSFKRNSGELQNQEFDLVVWDEAHNSYTERSQNALRYFPSAIKIGFSATPDYFYLEPKPGYREIDINGRTLYCNPEKLAQRYFPHELDNLSLREAIENGILCPVHLAEVDIDVDFSNLKVNDTKEGADYNGVQLDQFMDKGGWAVIRDAAIESILHGISQDEKTPEAKVVFRNKKIFAICTKIKQAEDLVDKLREKGITAECITGKTPSDERGEIFKKYKEGQISVLASVNVLKEGWDMPEAEVCLMLRPTISRTFYQQAMGRVLRNDPKNPEKSALVVDFVGKTSSMSPLTAAEFFGIIEFYNGELVIPPQQKRKEKSDADGTIKNNPYCENPYSVTPRIKIIEIVENLSEDTIKINNVIYCTKEKIASAFGIRKGSLDHYIKIHTVLAKRSKHKNYYRVDEIINEYMTEISKRIKHTMDQYWPIEELSNRTMLSRNYLESLCKSNSITSQRYTTGNKKLDSSAPITYKVEEAINLVFKELNRTLFTLTGAGFDYSSDPSKPASEQRQYERNEADIMLKSLNLKNPLDIKIGLGIILQQKGHGGIRDSLSRITISEVIPGARDLIERLKGRPDLLVFHKIQHQCERLLQELTSAEMKKRKALK